MSSVDDALAELFANEGAADGAAAAVGDAGKSWDVATYLNAKFPDESSLALLDAFAARTAARLAEVDGETRAAIRARAVSRRDVAQELKQAQTSIVELSHKIRDVQQKADATEKIVLEISRDIKRLDFAKQHLTSTITALKRFHMFVTATERLEFASETRRFDEAANLLHAVGELSEFFAPHDAVERIGELRRRVNRVRDALTARVFEDLDAFDASRVGAVALLDDDDEFSHDYVDDVGSPEALGGARAVAEALGPEVSASFKRSLVGKFLAPYPELFRPGTSDGSLDQFERRFAWIKRVTSGKRFDAAFPPTWGLREALLEGFVDKTQASLENDLLTPAVDVRELMRALKITKAFEAEKLNGRSDLSDSFLPYLSEVYVSAAVSKIQEEIAAARGAPTADATPSFEADALPSATAMFFHIGRALHRCEEFSTGEPYAALCEAVLGLLVGYAADLSAQIDRALAATTTADGTVSTYAALDTTKLVAVARVLRTCEYCADTVPELDALCRSKLNDDALRARVDLEPAVDRYFDVVAAGVGGLVASLRALARPALQQVHAIDWERFDSPGDESSYVKRLAANLRVLRQPLREALPEAYLRNVSDKFASGLLEDFHTALLKNKHLSTSGAQQLLVDVGAVKLVLEDVFSANSAALQTHARDSEITLKMVSMSATPSQLVENFILLGGTAKDRGTFRAVLVLRGVRKGPDQQSLMKQLLQRGDADA